MNKQGENGIEWTHIYGPGTGVTWNPIAGCRHACRWTMPDGTTARCYAEAIAEGLAQNAYSEGFSSHYWNPGRLDEPRKVMQPRGIFLDSMSDIMGHWVPEDQVAQVLKVVQECDWHTFFLLTKNAPRLLKFAGMFPHNLLVGVSMPPTFFSNSSLLSDESKEKYLMRAFDVLNQIQLLGITTWMSFEPLSFDVVPHIWTWAALTEMNLPIDWAVIGAASSGKTTYQPDPSWVSGLMAELGGQFQDIPVFMKGNLEWSPRREEFPEVMKMQDSTERSGQLSLL